MTDAMTDAAAGPDIDVRPNADALVDQTQLPNEQTNTIPEDDSDASPADRRSSAVSKAIDAALDEKPEKKAKAEPQQKAEVEIKEKVEAEVPKEPSAVVNAAPDPDEAPKPKATSYRDPPSGFDESAKAAWETVPESVRGAVHRRAQEMERGIEKYKNDAREFESVRKFSEMAKQSGTDLATALGRYNQMEQALRQDPITGLQAVVANLGMTKPDGSAVTLRDVAASIMGQTPDQAASKQEATIAQLTQQLHQVTQQIGGFSQHVEQQQQQARTISAESEWSSFQGENPRAKELEPQIAEFLNKYPAPDTMTTRERLADAYAWAAASNPEGAHTAALPLAQTQTPTAPNPAGQKSISGSPGANDAKSATRKLNRSAAVDKAMRAAGI